MEKFEDDLREWIKKKLHKIAAKEIVDLEKISEILSDMAYEVEEQGFFNFIS